MLNCCLNRESELLGLGLDRGTPAVMADNLGKGAALNAVQITEILIRDYL